MSDKDNGGPAFPCDRISCGNENAVFSGHGMTIRDYFAVHAGDEDVKVQIGILREKNNMGILPDGWNAIARYMHADAMLKERAK